MKFQTIALAAALAMGGCAATPDDILKQNGYVTQIPPSTQHGPGNLVYRKNVELGDNKVSLGYICDPSYLRFPKPPETSPSEKITFARNRTFEITGVDLPSIGISAGASYVDSVTLSFENTEIQEYSLEALSQIQESLGPVCRKILRKQQDAGNAYQVIGALKSDVSYEIKYKVDASVEGKNLVKREINAKLGLKADRTQGQTGKGLFYGVYLAPASSGTILVAATPR